ncbi:G-protein coupled receptor Mth-like [Drosophila eugracilis]|uniref:G-protein coupled receptor Mth-like n=1 Tax=Drosophila eugracilis TaxID=29029 RepID=UPI001BDB5DAF|nr:G-protein coupled receptor Mth-like [Drosophila eugracilis]
MTKKELDGIDPYLNITLDNGLVVKKYLKTDLIVQWDLPVTCDEMYYESNRQKDVSKNISLHHDKVVTIMQEYYHQNVYIKEDHNSTYIMPYSCLPPKSSKITQTVVMIISLVCMVLTISVYLYLKDLRNLLGKCFICYLVSLFMAYLFLVLDLWDLSNDFCVSAGYMGYFFAMSTFFWLSVISLHLWNAISGNSFLTNCFLTTNEFLTYNTYAWGMPITLTFVTFIANEFVKNEEWNPRVGYKMDCWVYTYDWSAVIYFYGPMLFLIAFNMIMFILTAFQITMVKRIIKNFAIKQDREHKICMDKQK